MTFVCSVLRNKKEFKHFPKLYFEQMVFNFFQKIDNCDSVNWLYNRFSETLNCLKRKVTTFVKTNGIKRC